MSGVKKDWADILSEDLAKAPKPEGLDEYIAMLRQHRVKREPPSIKQSPENLRPLTNVEGRTKFNYT